MDRTSLIISTNFQFNSMVLTNEELGKVNPLYGPGTVAGWYFVIIGVLISWLLYPKKRNSDSISVDLITVLTLPGVASAHLISLMHHQRSWRQQFESSGPQWDKSLRPEQFAALAPFNVMRAFLPMSILLLNIALARVCLKRVCLVSSFAVVCTKVLLMYSHMFNLTRHGPVDRVGSDHVKINWLASFLSGWLGLPALIALVAACLVAHEQPEHLALPMVGSTLFQLTYYAFSFVFTRPDVALDQKSRTQRLKALTFLFPESNSSLRDLDQAVAAAAGATVLLFNLYSVVSAWYKYRTERSKPQTRRRLARRTRRYLQHIDHEPKPIGTAQSTQTRGCPHWQIFFDLPGEEDPSLSGALVAEDGYTDHELGPIRPLSGTNNQHPGQRSEPESLAVQEAPQMSGALAIDSTDEEEPGAPLPIESSQICRDPSLHVRSADQVEPIV